MDVFSELAGTRVLLAAAEARAESLEDALTNILAATWNQYDRNRWHVRKGCGVQFSEAVKAARELLSLPDPRQERDAGAEG